MYPEVHGSLGGFEDAIANFVSAELQSGLKGFNRFYMTDLTRVDNSKNQMGLRVVATNTKGGLDFLVGPSEIQQLTIPRRISCNENEILLNF